MAKLSERRPKAKAPRSSEVRTTELVMPQHTNPAGSIFGGIIMSWIDVAAAIATMRHAGKNCVTASVDELHFLSPIKKGYVVNIHAIITAVHVSSCEVKVEVTAENPQTNEFFRSTRAFLTFVSLDDYGRPTSMPPLKTESAEEKKYEAQAQLRRDNRKRFKAELEATPMDPKAARSDQP